MEKFEYRGEWWIPDEDSEDWIPEASDRTAGVLEFDPENGGELDLMGALTSVGEPSQQVETIHGRITKGKLVTLCDCFVVQSGFSAGSASMRNQTTYIQKVFTNELSIGGEPEFEQLRVTYPLLEMWARANSVVPVMPPDYEFFGARMKSLDPVVAELDGAEIKLSITNRSTKKEWKGIELSETAQITITPKEPLTFSEYLDDYVRRLQHLLCLATGEPLNPDTITGINPSEEDGKEKHQVDIAYQVAHLPDVSENKHPNKVLFSLNDIEFESTIQNWFESARGAQTLHNLYFSTVYNDSMFEENRFLSLAIAIEGYQSYLFPDYRLMDRDDYDELKEDIMDTIPDESPVRDRVEGLLTSIGNEPSLRNQIEMVFGEYDDILSELIDVGDVAKRTTDNRHKLAHALEDEFDTAALGDLARTLQVVIEAFLLDEIGLDSDFIVDKLTNNRKYYLSD